MSELIDRQTLDRAFTQLRFDSDGKLAHWGDRKDWCLHGSEVEKLISDAPTIPAPRWHRVEEPPKEEGRYWFAVWFDGHWIFDAAWYTHDISKVIGVPCCERVGGFYKGYTEVHPDYWMPIEPPKEEE